MIALRRALLWLVYAPLGAVGDALTTIARWAYERKLALARTPLPALEPLVCARCGRADAPDYALVCRGGCRPGKGARPS